MKRTNWRILPIMLVAVIVISLVGCGKKSDEDLPTQGDYSFQANQQYTFDGIEGDVSAENEDGSDTDSTGRVYNNNKNSGNGYNGSYGGSYKNPGYVNEYNPGKDNGKATDVKNDGSNITNDKDADRFVARILKIIGNPKTYEEAKKALESYGINVTDIIDKALKKYYDSQTETRTTMDESRRNELESKFDDIINNRPTRAPTTTAPVAE